MPEDRVDALVKDVIQLLRREDSWKRQMRRLSAKLAEVTKKHESEKAEKEEE